MTRARTGLGGLAITVGLVLAGCAAPDSAAEQAPEQSWADVQAEARGQTVSLWMYGGDPAGNAYVDDVLTPAAADLGVTLRRVPVADTAEAIDRVLDERQAGSTDGDVDLVWVNGANFATAKQAGAWLCGWAGGLPSAQYLDPDDSTLGTDFGTPTEGCESPWHRAQFTLFYDAARVPDPPTTLAGVLDWAQANPGRFTYPAPPDFTGSVFVRQVLTSVVADAPADIPLTFDQDAYDEVAPALWERLQQLQPSLWRGGADQPTSQAELDQLFADGEVDFAMTYGPATLTDLVAEGTFPPTTRVLTLTEGTVGNASYLALPASSGSRAGAQVVADLALSPAQQLAKAGPQTWGQFTVLDLDLLPDDDRAAFEALPASPVVPPLAELAANAQSELAAEWVSALDEGWRTQVQAG